MTKLAVAYFRLSRSVIVNLWKFDKDFRVEGVSFQQLSL